MSGFSRTIPTGLLMGAITLMLAPDGHLSSSEMGSPTGLILRMIDNSF